MKITSVEVGRVLAAGREARRYGAR